VTTSFQLPEQLPALLITECPQSPRNTRPPVPVASNLRPLTSLPSPDARPDRPILPIDLAGDTQSPRRVKSRRRRGNTVPRERSQPAFWRPDPAIHGKSLGYALGYPGSWAPYKPEQTRYQRDTMRKGVHADTIWT
jgi:hypothetical protein